MFENITEAGDVANDYVICCRPVPSNVRSAVKPSCAPSTFIATYERFTSKYANIPASYVAKRLAVPAISNSTRWHIRRFSLLVEWTLTHFYPSEGMWKNRRIYSQYKSRNWVNYGVSCLFEVVASTGLPAFITGLHAIPCESDGWLSARLQ